jgi:hypothetical protein
MLDQLKEAVAFSALNPHDKHVDVLLKSSAICREMGAVTAILCKSGTYSSCLRCYAAVGGPQLLLFVGSPKCVMHLYPYFIGYDHR